MDLDNLCHTCGATFKNRLGRIKHEVASHSGKLLGCKECPYTAFGAKNLNNHMQKHQETQCSFCLKNLPTSSLAKHKAICLKNPEQIVVRCDQCPYETTRKDSLKRHLLNHKKTVVKCKEEKLAPKKIELNCRQVKVAKKSECGVCKNY